MARVEGRYSDFIIIKTNRPYFCAIDMFKDPEMARLKEHELSGTLPEQKNPTVQPRAGLYQKPSMLMEDYLDETDDTPKKRFKDQVVLVEADSEGRIFLAKEEKDLAKRIYKTLKRIDEDISIDSASALSEIEIMGTTEPKKSPGRPRKDSYR